MKKSQGKFVQIMTRRLQHYLGQKVTQFDWNVSFLLSFEVVSEIQLFLKNFRAFNGHPIRTTDAPLKVMCPKEVEYELLNVNTELLRKKMSIFVSDASDSVAYCFEANSMSFSKDFTFNENERLLSSSLRELLAIHKSLSQHKEYFKSKSGEVLYWITDSKCCESFLKKGSRKEHIQDVLLDIKRIEFELRLTIIPIWAPRTDLNLVLADIGSRLSSSTDEWKIDDHSFELLQSHFGVRVSCDCFATSSNTRCDKFFSHVPQMGSCGINFFAQTLLPGEIYWICLPPNLILKVLKVVLTTAHITAIFCIPVWKHKKFWPVLMQNSQFALFVIDPLFFKPVFVPDYPRSPTIFRGRKNFDMLAFRVST